MAKLIVLAGKTGKLMSIELLSAVGVIVALFGFLWSIKRDIVGIRRDMGDLRERMARLGGMFEVFTGRSEAPTIKESG